VSYYEHGVKYTPGEIEEDEVSIDNFDYEEDNEEG